MKIWIVYIRDQTVHSVQSDLDLHCPQKLFVSSSLRKDLKVLAQTKLIAQGMI